MTIYLLSAVIWAMRCSQAMIVAGLVWLGFVKQCMLQVVDAVWHANLYESVGVMAYAR